MQKMFSTEAKKKTETAKAERTMHINQNKIPKTWKFRDQIQRPKPQQKGKKIKKRKQWGQK